MRENQSVIVNSYCAPWFFFLLLELKFVHIWKRLQYEPEEVNKRGEKSRSARESELLFGEK